MEQKKNKKERKYLYFYHWEIITVNILIIFMFSIYNHFLRIWAVIVLYVQFCFLLFSTY